jgi:hypothetical protein
MGENHVSALAFAVFRLRLGGFGRQRFCVWRWRAGSAGILLSSHGNDRGPGRHIQRQDMPRLLGLRLRRPVLPAMFDFAVAATVVLTDKLQGPAGAASDQVKIMAAVFVATAIVMARWS